MAVDPASPRPLTPFGGVLSGVRVVEVASSFPGRLCGKLLADAGADVVTVGVPDTTMDDPPHAAAWSTYLDFQKRSSGLSAGTDADRESIDDLLRETDLFIT